MSFRPRPRKEEEQADWLDTFADMATLLLCFFIILFALSTVDPKEQGAIFGILSGEFDKKEDKVAQKESYESLQQNVLSLNTPANEQFLFVTQNGRDIEIELASGAFFASGSSQFRKEGIPVLEAVAEKLLPLMATEKAIINVEGHTDNVPIASKVYPSNWELSGGRSSNVVRFLIAKGIDPKLLAAIGYAETRPKAENEDATGTPIPANQELNRRVVINVKHVGSSGGLQRFD